MKLASLRDGSRDGLLLVVSRDLERARLVPDIARTLQQALDDWKNVELPLRAIYAGLDESTGRAAMRFEPQQAMAPLPRAYHWVDGSAYVRHIELVRLARGAPMPPEFWTEPIIYQGGSDDLLGPCDDAPFPSIDHGIDFEAELGVIVDDVPLGTNAAGAAPHIKLLTLLNDWSLRALIPAELAKGFGFYQSKPATAFAPVVITPDELGAGWDGRRARAMMRIYRNDELFGSPLAGVDMTFDFPTLIAHAARTRRLGAGTIVGAGTVCNRAALRGSACIAEQRAIEVLGSGNAVTPFLNYGERVRIEMLNDAGDSLFGMIDQRVTAALDARQSAP